MTFAVADRVLETSITTGTGTYTLAGAEDGYQSFSVIGNGNVCPYFAYDDDNWEVGLGSVATGSPNTLARTTVLSSSNAGAAVNWGAGTRYLLCGMPAALGMPRIKSVSIAGGAGTQVLTQTEQRCDILILTGVITGNRVIEVDATPWRWTVFNNTSGAFTVTVKVNGQTGVAVTQGKTKDLYCDGTDVEDGYTDTVSPGAASESAAGIIEIATQGETDTGTDDARAVTPLKLHTTNLLKWQTEIAVASGSSHSQTGIPSGVTEILIALDDISLTDTTVPVIQLGDSGGLETSGYTGQKNNVTTTGASGAASGGSGFEISNSNVAAATWSGMVKLWLEDPTNNVWTCTIHVGRTDSANFSGFFAGRKALSATLDRVAIVGGTFDGGGAMRVGWRR